jgi:hypothetical protein
LTIAFRKHGTKEPSMRAATLIVNLGFGLGLGLAAVLLALI